MAVISGSNYHFSATIDVDTPIIIVWAYLSDVSRWHEWDTELLSAEIEGNMTVGAIGHYVPRKGPRLAYTISSCTPGRSYSFRTSLPLGALIITRTLSETKTGTKFKDEIVFTGPLRRLLGFFLGRQFIKVLPEVMSNFKVNVEKKM